MSFLDLQLTAYTTTLAGFVQPAVDSSIEVTVQSTLWMPLGVSIYISGTGYYEIEKILDATRVRLINSGGTGSVAPGSNVPANLRLIAVGQATAGGGGGGGDVDLPANPGDNGKVAIALNGKLTYGFVSTTNIANGAVTLSKLANIATDRLLGRDTAGSGSPEEISLDTTLAWSGTGAIGRAAITGDVTIASGSNSSTIATAAVTYAKIQNVAGLSVVGRGGNTTGVPAAITGTDGQALRVSGTTLGFGTLATAAYADGSVTLAKLQNGTGLSVVGRATNTAGVNADIVGTDGQALRVSGTTLGFGTLATAAYADNSVTLAKLATQAALTVLANATNATAVPTAVAATGDGQVFLRSGTTLAFGTIGAASITNSTITLAKLANGTGLSVLGRAANTAGVYADITGTDGQALRVSGTTLGFGTLATAAYTDASVTYAKVQNGTGLSVVGRSTNTAGANADIVGTDGQVLRVNGTTLGFGTLAAGAYTDGTITLAKLADGTACSVVGRSANSTGPHADISIGTNDHVLMRTSNVVTSGFVANANVSATAAIAGTKISPNFGSQPITTTGVISLGVNPASTGIVRIPNNQGLYARNAANSADIPAILLDNSNVVFVGASTGAETIVRAATSLSLRLGSTDQLALTTSQVTVTPATIVWTAANTAVELTQLPNATNGATAATLYLTAQRATGTTSTGGNLELASGRGTSADGSLIGKVGTSTMFVLSPSEAAIGGYATPVSLKAGGASDANVHIYVGDGSNQIRCDVKETFLEFDIASAHPSAQYSIRHSGTTFITFARSIGNGPRMAFWGGTPITQPGDIGALTISVGTADGVIADVGTSFNQTTLNNNFRDLTDKVNALRSVVRGYTLTT